MKDGFIKVACATPKIKVANTRHNGGAIIDIMETAAFMGAKVLVFPELCITGYTCADLFLQPTLLDSAKAVLVDIAKASSGKDMLTAVGLPLSVNGRLYNCAAVVYDGRILAVIPKTNIPNYAEFYEKRWFSPAPVRELREIFIGGQRVPFGTGIIFRNGLIQELSVGIEICEDLWVPNPPSVNLAMNGATLILNLSASDETVAKDDYRRDLVSGQSARLVCGYMYADAGDGESTQDLVYTGHNLICENGAILAESTETSGIIFSEIDVKKLDTERRKLGTFNCDGDDMVNIYWGKELSDTTLTRDVSRTPFVPENPYLRDKRCEKIMSLQALGLKKRIEHTKSDKVVIGLSGGLDSTLAILIAAKTMDMLHKSRKNIIAVTMPCFGTTNRTRSNAEILADSLMATLRTVDITVAVNQHFSDIGHNPESLDVTFENSQARERTQVLMDIANQEGALVIGTGDLSELALGWATYNGDHMSMYGVNASVPKTLVRYLVSYAADTCGNPALIRCLNGILDTPVSPELLPAENGEISQKTEDLVGPYELHDFFLYNGIRWGFSPLKVYRLAKYAFAGEYTDDVILKWLKIFYRRFFAQQFKRSCLPDGPKVGTLTLSPRGDWRMPSDGDSSIWLRELESLN